jgi:hypothetical protein
MRYDTMNVSRGSRQGKDRSGGNRTGGGEGGLNGGGIRRCRRAGTGGLGERPSALGGLALVPPQPRRRPNRPVCATMSQGERDYRQIRHGSHSQAASEHDGHREEVASDRPPPIHVHAAGSRRQRQQLKEKGWVGAGSRKFGDSLMSRLSRRWSASGNVCSPGRETAGAVSVRPVRLAKPCSSMKRYQ